MCVPSLWLKHAYMNRAFASRLKPHYSALKWQYLYPTGGELEVECSPKIPFASQEQNPHLLMGLMQTQYKSTLARMVFKMSAQAGRSWRVFSENELFKFSKVNLMLRVWLYLKSLL